MPVFYSDRPRLPDCPLVANCSARCTRSQRDVTDMSGIRSAAGMFVERFGRDALAQAELRADELLSVGNYEGRARWQLIGREIGAILGTD